MGRQADGNRKTRSGSSRWEEVGGGVEELGSVWYVARCVSTATAYCLLVGTMDPNG